MTTASAGTDLLVLISLTSFATLNIILFISEGYMRKRANRRQHHFILAMIISEAALERLFLFTGTDGLLPLCLHSFLGLLL